MSKLLRPVWLSLMLLFPTLALAVPAKSWPKEIKVKEGRIVVYQPQMDSFKGKQLTARAAVSVKLKSAKEPEYGAVWLSAGIRTNIDERTVSLERLRVTKVAFDDASAEDQKALAELLERELSEFQGDYSWNHFVSALESAERARVEAKQLGTKVPKIIFRAQPTILLVVDGPVQSESIELTGINAIKNTPFLFLHEPSFKTFALYGGLGTWYYADHLRDGGLGPWKPAPSLGGRFRNLEPDHDDERYSPKRPPAHVPAVITALEPTELIVTRGQPKFVDVVPGKLQAMSNTTSEVLLHRASSQLFVLLSGRWFAAKSPKGPWRRVRANKLPPVFAKIPPESKYGWLRAWVSGTDAAKRLVLEASVPQTARVSRKKATQVRYDGKPIFTRIDGTSLEIAENTESQVLKSKSGYFAVEHGVWYRADKATGPWSVASERASGVEKIPPASPAYNVRFVEIYGADATHVEVGYTAGYENTFVEDGVLVYGTGWRYPPYWAKYAGKNFDYCYPKPITYGFQARYHPRQGWQHRMSHRSEFDFAVSKSAWHSGFWWGPAGYRPLGKKLPGRNLYRDIAPPHKAKSAKGARRAFLASELKNNVFVDRDGRVYKIDRVGDWNRRGGKNWQPTKPSKKVPRAALQSRARAQIWARPYAFPSTY